MQFYVYRTTTEKLEAALNEKVAASGDSVLAVAFQGGRDWVIVAQRDPALSEVRVP